MKSLLSSKFLDWFLQQRVLLHIFFWGVVLVYFTLSYAHNGKYGLEFYRSLAFLPNHIWLAYTFFYLLLPFFLFKDKILLFLGLAIVCIGLNMYFSYLINFRFLSFFKMETFWSIGGSLLGCLTILGIAVSIKLLRYWYKEKKKNLLIQKEKIDTELQMLKSQVHPHFLFNTLNNVYSLTLEKSDDAPAVVLKLADLLRYMLYECNDDLVFLDKELEMMNYYFSLEQMRYGDRLVVSKSYSGITQGILIPPLLFLPLLENCFKYGTSRQIDQCWISIFLNVENDILSLKLINSKANEEIVKPFVSGIGLQNVQKRLQLMYPDNYTLKIIPAEDTYTVSLTIPVNKAKLNLNKIISNQSDHYEHQLPVSG